jgi:hypothetical protein
MELATQIAARPRGGAQQGDHPPRPQTANIKITPEGKVKVLEFGLAKAFGDGGAEGLASAYDVSADGKRFLMITSGAAEQGAMTTPEVHFVLEWFEDIRRRVRAGG